MQRNESPLTLPTPVVIPSPRPSDDESVTAWMAPRSATWPFSYS